MRSPLRFARKVARSLTLSGLGLGLEVSGGLSRAIQRPRIHFLYFHDVSETGLPNFRKLLRWLTSHGRLIGHAEGVSRLETGEIDRPYYSISFDDGFVSCLEAAAAIESFGGRGCFYVNPGAIDLPESASRDRFCRERIRAEPLPFMTWTNLATLRDRGHEIGNHTLTHVDLGHPDRPLEDEIAGSRETIIRRLGECNHFAWPFGRLDKFSAAARAAVFASGHQTCASAIRGAHVSASSRSRSHLCIRREHLDSAWPLHHQRFLIARSAMRASAADNDWPPLK